MLFYFPRRPTSLDDRIRASMGTELLFISRDDASWKGYEQLLPGPREWRSIEDARIIAKLLEQNSDPKVEHKVMHRVSTTMAKGAEALVELFKKLELVDIDTVGKKPELANRGRRAAHDPRRREHLEGQLPARVARGQVQGQVPGLNSRADR